MRVDQPRKHGRIAVIDKVTVGWWLVPHRLNPDNATILDKHSCAAGPEFFTIEGMVCMDREHTAWLPNPAARVNALPCRRAPGRISGCAAYVLTIADRFAAIER